MRNLTILCFSLLVIACSSTKHQQVLVSYPKAVVGKSATLSPLTYHWITTNNHKVGLLVYIPGKGKSGAYKLEIIVDMDYTIKSARAVNHPGQHGGKVNRALKRLAGTKLEKVDIDATSGATITTYNARRIFSRNSAKIRSIIDQQKK